MIAGIATGLTAAFCQTLTYLSARHYVQRRVGAASASEEAPISRAAGGESRQLLVLAHVWMALFSITLWLLAAPAGGLAITAEMVQVFILMAGFYMLGQVGTMIALRHAEPSRVSPLLGFKIVVLAIMVCFWEQPHLAGVTAIPRGLTWLQWVAVALAVVAAAALSYVGKRLKWQALLGIMLAVISYSIADWNITRSCVAVVTSSGKTDLGTLQAAFLVVAICHGICGVAAVPLLPLWGSTKKKDWLEALPYAAAWFIAMLFLYWCFTMVGPLLGNILQSTRGLMSILMGSILVYHGHLHIEPAHDRGVFMRRLAAGVLMFLAVSLYVLREPGNLRNLMPGGGAGATKVTSN